MQRQNRISDVASIETRAPIRMKTDQAMQGREEHNWPSQEPIKYSAKERTFSSDSTISRIAIGVKDYFKDYCNITSIHGVQYFADDGPLLIEKIFWVIAITLSMAGCTLLILKVWQKWDTSPVIVSFAESSTSIWQVPFPAVSVCPETKCRPNVFNFTDYYHKHFDYLENKTKPDVGNNVTEDISAEELFGVEAVSLVCDRYLLTKGKDIMPAGDTKAFIKKVAPQFRDVLLICSWHGNLTETCIELFTPVWSDAGICFTFNMLDHQEIFTENAVQYGEMSPERPSGGWDLEKSFLSNAEAQTFPRRMLRGGEGTGLTITIRQKSEHDHLCRSASTGFKVGGKTANFVNDRGIKEILLHDPAEIPRAGQEFFHAPLNRRIFAAVKPSLMTTSPGLRDYAPHRRQCYFPRERQLRFFQVYTKRNCELECITNFTLKRCGCVEIYMPRDNQTDICGPGKRYCAHEAVEESLRLEVRTDVERQVRGERLGTRKTECDCIASCISLEYDVEAGQDEFDFKSAFKAHRLPLTSIEASWRLTRILIFFKDTHFLASHRSELYGPTDFLANCGGLLGLFSGFSIVSLIEILYFLTIRLWCRLGKSSKCRKSLAASQPSIVLDPPEKLPY